VTRFHVRPEAITGDRVAFDAEEAHHLARVLRLRPGATVQTLDGQGHELTIRLTRVGRRGAEGDVVGRAVRASESPLDLTLVQGVPRGEKFETVVRMATELGVARIVPLVSARTVRRWQDRPSARVTRWQRVAREAAKQSGRAVVPEVRDPVALDVWLSQAVEPGLLLCLWESEPTPLAAMLPERPPERATIVVGPEGGLTDMEVQSLRSAGAVVAGLGPRILRADTAGPVALALLQFRYGDLGSSRHLEPAV
jgi:16S rRNA (uracil1498-N3)-methyltransferase